MNIHISLNDDIQCRAEKVAKDLGFNLSSLIGNILDIYLDNYQQRMQPDEGWTRNERIKTLVGLGADITKISKIYGLSRQAIYDITKSSS